MDTTVVLLSEYIREKELHLVFKVGSFNMKMQDHLLKIRDNPVKQQLLDLLLVILAQTFNLKKIQRECSFPLLASLSCHTWFKHPCAGWCPICLWDLSMFPFSAAVRDHLFDPVQTFIHTRHSFSGPVYWSLSCTCSPSYFYYSWFYQCFGLHFL